MITGAYVPHSDLQVFPPPIRCGGVHLYAFFAKADPEKLQRWVDHWFNAPSQGELHFKALGSFVMISFQEVERLQSLDVSAEQIGYTTELEASIWLPIAQRPPHQPIAGLSLPWIWPDSSLAVATGRELYGFRKAHSWIRMPTVGEHGHHDEVTKAACAAARDGSDGDASFVLDTLSFDHFGKDSMARRHETMRIERIDPPSSGPLVELGDKITDLQAALAEQTGGLAPVADMLAHFANLEVPMLLTKQFRAVGSSHEACHLAVTECRATNLEFDALHYLLGRWRLVLRPLASLPIASELGLPVDADGTMELEPMSMRISYSFDLDRGTTLWRMREPEPFEAQLARRIRTTVESGAQAITDRIRGLVRKVEGGA